MAQLARGVRGVQRGLGVLSAHPALWMWIIAPAVITAHLPSGLAHVASPLLATMIVIGLSIGVALVFVPLAGI